MPKRLVRPDWYIRHKNLIGYLILFVGVIFALAGVRQNEQNTKHEAVARAEALAHQSCLSAKDTRAPLIDYLDSELALTDKVRAAHLLPPAPPALRKLQNESLTNLRTLTRVFKERQAEPCPPAP